MKKILALVLALAMTLTLAACGGDTTPEPTAPAAQNTPATPDAAAREDTVRGADGAMRAALSLTDQCLSRAREIDADVVASATGLAGREHLYALSAAVREHRSGEKTPTFAGHVSRSFLQK